MKKIGCYQGLAEREDIDCARPLGGLQRRARATAGLAFIASAGVLYVWPLALLVEIGLPSFVAWPLATLTLWLGISHLVAGATGYRGCPEIGAIPSLLLRRRVVTSCKPWERFDRRVEGHLA
jgi:hypothetical protein